MFELESGGGSAVPIRHPPHDTAGPCTSETASTSMIICARIIGRMNRVLDEYQWILRSPKWFSSIVTRTALSSPAWGLAGARMTKRADSCDARAPVRVKSQTAGARGIDCLSPNVVTRPVRKGDDVYA